MVLSDDAVDSYVHLMIYKEGSPLDHIKHYSDHVYLFVKSWYDTWLKVRVVFVYFYLFFFKLSIYL